MAATETPTAVFDTVEKEARNSLEINESRPRILSVSEYETDHTALRRILDNTHWRLTSVRTCREALDKLPYMGALVVFCECSLPDGAWKDILEVTLTLQERVPLVVTSAIADERLWSEVLNLGGYDVLAKPFVEDEVRRVLDSVWRVLNQPVRRTRTLRAAS
jgi:PleD family two-component response regulator